jgi:hypothetical protein
MYTFVDFTSQIAGRRGVPCPTNKGVSYTNLVCWLGRDLKNRLLLLLLYIYHVCNNVFDFSLLFSAMYALWGGITHIRLTHLIKSP